MPQIIVRYKNYPKKRLGQNFLRDDNIVNKIISHCQLKKSDSVIEIGSGLGALTEKICKASGKVYAVEIDRDLCQILDSSLSACKNLEILNLDFLKINFQKFKKKFKIIGNLPFYITTPIISHIISQRQFLDSIFITVQKELAQRAVAGPGNKQYGAFSCFVQFYTEPKILFNIKRGCFWPRPEVDASFIRLQIRNKPVVEVGDEKLFLRLIRTAFNQRRKTVLNSLQKIIPKDKLLLLLNDLNISATSRAENLSLEDFARIEKRI